MKRRVRKGDLKQSSDSTEANSGLSSSAIPSTSKSNYFEWFLNEKLWEETPAESLVILRILWGLIMTYESYTYIVNDYSKLIYMVFLNVRFTYWGFDWVGPLPGNGMFILVWFMALMAIFITIGFCYRTSSLLFFLMFSYLFLQEMSLYLNHFYLVALVSFVFIFLDLGRCYSVDSWLKNGNTRCTVPYWNFWLLKSLFSIVYFFAGMAKLNVDWLRGEPLLHWLPKRRFLPYVGVFLDMPIVAYIFSYCGLLLDTFIGPAMHFPILRPFGFLALVSFHAMNKIIFNIGIFPWVMLASTIVYCDPGLFSY
jgi:vitamin K-dependent gamma-carboxylase